MTEHPGPIALVGSGEFLDAMAPIDAELLRGRPPRVAVVPTAAGLEAPSRVRYWFDLAQRHYRALGVEVVEVAALDPTQAADPRHAALIAGCGLVYLSGGNPHHLADSLVGSPLWAAIEDAWRGGAALAGCSAGAMALAQTVVARRGRQSIAGLGVVTGVCVLPHFDRYFARQSLPAAPPDTTLVGIDEQTALVGGAGRWVVHGRSTVTVFGPQGPAVHAAGTEIELGAAAPNR